MPSCWSSALIVSALLLTRPADAYAIAEQRLCDSNDCSGRCRSGVEVDEAECVAIANTDDSQELVNCTEAGEPLFRYYTNSRLCLGTGSLRVTATQCQLARGGGSFTWECRQSRRSDSVATAVSVVFVILFIGCIVGLIWYCCVKRPRDREKQRQRELEAVQASNQPQPDAYGVGPVQQGYDPNAPPPPPGNPPQAYYYADGTAYGQPVGAAPAPAGPAYNGQPQYQQQTQHDAPAKAV